MRINKRAQAILPFFALQLVSLMIFFIVILTLLTMAKNVRYTVQAFDEQSAVLLAQRRMIASADCFAAEVKDITFDEQNNLITGYTVHPGLLDVDKMNDIDYFNCMRKDNYDILNEVKDGLWDAEQGTGYAFRYSVAVYDLKTKSYVYNPSGTEYDTHTIHSILTRVAKEEASCWMDLPSDRKIISFCGVYGLDWRCIVVGALEVDPRAESGRCSDRDNIFQFTGTDFKPFWQYILPNTAKYTAGVGAVDVIIPSRGYTQYRWTNEDPTGYGEYTITCRENENAHRSIMPVMLKSGTEIHPGLMIMESCGIYGENYDGITVLDVTVEAQPGKECVT